jgi:hypothetical protein
MRPRPAEWHVRPRPNRSTWAVNVETVSGSWRPSRVPGDPGLTQDLPHRRRGMSGCTSSRSLAKAGLGR